MRLFAPPVAAQRVSGLRIGSIKRRERAKEAPALLHVVKSLAPNRVR
jgi:hypothetical protein